MTVRALASIASQAMPGRTAARRLGLGALEDGVTGQEVGVGAVRATGHPEGPRGVGAVALEDAADVEHDGIAGADPSIAGIVVRGGRVGAGGDDGEGGFVMTRVEEPLVDLSGDLRLAAPDQPPGCDGFDDVVRRRPCGAQAIDLIGVFDGTQLGECRAGEPEGRPGEARLQRQGVHRPQVIGEQEAPRIGAGRQAGRHPFDRIVGLVPADHVDQAGRAGR